MTGVGTGARETGKGEGFMSKVQGKAAKEANKGEGSINGIQGKIQGILEEIEEKEHVTILLAVESGSRAWGFASPDSDYDVRFIYMRRFEDYLKLEGFKDVIDWQLDEVLDINGWDLKKALQQFYRGNATLFEWANSPVAYYKSALWDGVYREAKQYFSKKAALCHYYGTAHHTFKQYLQGDMVRYKKYFYALRPLLACRYIEERDTNPPVLFGDLLELSLPGELRLAIQELLDIKKITEEKELNPQMPAIQAYIQSEIKRQKQLADNMADDRKKEWEPLDRVFMETLKMQGSFK